MNIKEEKKRKVINIEEKIQIPECIQQLREQSLNRKEAIQRILELLCVPKEGKRYQYLVKAIEIQCSKTSEMGEVYEQIREELQGTNVIGNIRSIVKNITNNQSNQEMLEKMWLKEIEITNQVFILTMAEHVKYIEGIISQKEMKIRNLLKLMQIARHSTGYEYLVKMIVMQGCKVGTAREVNKKMQKAKQTMQMKDVYNPSKQRTVAGIIQNVCDNPNNADILQLVGIRNSYDPQKYFISRLAEYIEILEKPISKRKMLIRELLDLMEAPKNVKGYEYFIRAVDIQANIMESNEAKTKQTIEIFHDNKTSSQISYNINYIVEQISSNPNNRGLLEKMGFKQGEDINATEMIYRFAEYMRLANKVNFTKEKKVRETLHLLMASRALLGYEYLVRVLSWVYADMEISEIYKKLSLENDKEIREITKCIRRTINQIYNRLDNEETLKMMGFEDFSKVPTTQKFVSTIAEYIKAN